MFNPKIHNMRVKITKAFLSNDHDTVCAVAQEIFEADLELEEIQLRQPILEGIVGVLFYKKWSPKINELMS